MGLLGTTSEQAYYEGDNLGNYRYTSLTNIVNNFMIAYVGDGKLIDHVAKSDVLFHAKRGLQEFSYDVLRTVKSIEVEMGPSLSLAMPQDYVSYVKLTYIGSDGVKRIIYPTTLTINPVQNPAQDEDFEYIYDDAGDVIEGDSYTEEKWKNFDNYMPLFVIPNDLDASVLDEMQYEDPTANKAGRWSTAGSLQYATVPDSYIAEGMRLNLGDYMKNSFHSLKGSDLDATARQDVMTLYNLFNSPLFKKQFSNENDFNTFKSLFGDEFLKTFNGEVNKGRNPYTDYGDNNFFGKQTTFGKKFNETASTILSVGSATALASLTQPTQQYYSAIGNNMMRVNSPEARAFLQGKSGLFMFGLSQASNGTKAKSYATKFIQDIFGQGDKSNIYAKSQTSLRNAITAELPLDKTTKRDVSYYANTFGIPETTFIKFGISGSYTFDAILNRMQQNSELALEVFLARADKAAANASFEAHYLDYKIKNGSKYPGDSKGRMEWWKKENENPDIGAINYADGVIKEVMRPSNELSEAGIYKQSQSGLVKNTIRTIFPYAKFGLNAKTNFWTQYTIANDPNVPQEQREEANRKMQGLMLEVGTFQALKVTMAATLYGTLPEVLFGFSEEEIERYGGLNMMISEVMLPLSDAEFMKNFKQELEKETKQGWFT